MSNLVITEDDLFASIIPLDELTDDFADKIRFNINTFLNAVPFNIFNNEYFAIFQAISDAKKYGVLLSSMHFNQILLANVEKLINSPNVRIEDFASDPSDTELVKEEFIGLCCSKYDELMLAEKDFNRYAFSIRLYVENWVSSKLKELMAKSYKINTEGLHVGKKFLHGPIDANDFYLKKSADIFSILNSGETSLSKIVFTADGFNAYQEDIVKSMVNSNVSSIGIESVDELIGPLQRGDVIVVLGPTGGGKTRFSSNIAYNAIIEGKSGVYFALEGSPRRTVCLFIAKHLANKFGVLDIDADAVFKRNFDPSYADIVNAAEYDLSHNEAYGKFQVIPSPLYDTDIESVLDGIWDNVDGKGYTFDWVAIDHTSLVQSKQFNNITDILTNLMPKLEVMAQSYKGQGFMLILPHQLKVETIKELMKGNNQTLIGASDSSAVMKSAHMAFTIFTDEDLKLRDMARLICTKARNSQGFPMKEIYALLGICEFSDL